MLRNVISGNISLFRIRLRKFKEFIIACLLKTLFLNLDFDVNMTKKLLLEIIAKMEDNGFIIHGVSFDCGNKTLIKECGVQLSGEDQKFWFPNPRDSTRKVYLFPGNYIEGFQNLKKNVQF